MEVDEGNEHDEDPRWAYSTRQYRDNFDEEDNGLVFDINVDDISAANNQNNNAVFLHSGPSVPAPPRRRKNPLFVGFQDYAYRPAKAGYYYMLLFLQDSWQRRQCLLAVAVLMIIVVFVPAHVFAREKSASPAPTDTGEAIVDTDDDIVGPICLSNHTELFQAVREYLDPETKRKAQGRYGDTMSSWCVDAVTNMDRMFRFLEDFSEDLSGWDTSRVTSMESVFMHTTRFSADISGWDVSSVLNMRAAFANVYNFSSGQYLSRWDTSSVTNMERLFMSTEHLKVDVTNWSTQNVILMRELFRDTVGFQGDVSAWNTENVLDMGSLFAGSTGFDADVSGWQTAKVEDMDTLVAYTEDFGQLSSVMQWDVSSLIDMVDMFREAEGMDDVDLCHWGPQLKGRIVAVEAAFFGTNCSDPSDPQMDRSPPGPFCRPC